MIEEKAVRKGLLFLLCRANGVSRDTGANKTAMGYFKSSKKPLALCFFQNYN